MKKIWISSKMRGTAQAGRSITDDVRMILRENLLALTKNVTNTMVLKAHSTFISKSSTTVGTRQIGRR